MNDDRQLAKVMAEWWHKHINAETGSARAANATLRRAVTAPEALAHPATHLLIHALAAQGWTTTERTVERVASVALVLPHIKASSTNSAARLFGQGEHPPLSQARFRKIVTAPAGVELATLLRRALPLIGGKAQVGGLGEDLLYWNDRRRNRWCLEYFNTYDLGKPQKDDAA